MTIIDSVQLRYHETCLSVFQRGGREGTVYSIQYICVISSHRTISSRRLLTLTLLPTSSPRQSLCFALLSFVALYAKSSTEKRETNKRKQTTKLSPRFVTGERMNSQPHNRISASFKQEQTKANKANTVLPRLYFLSRRETLHAIAADKSVVLYFPLYMICLCF